MSETQERELISTVQRLAAEVARLRERVDDLEDAKELSAAILRNGEKALLNWEDVRDEAASVRARYFPFVFSPASNIDP